MTFIYAGAMFHSLRNFFETMTSTETHILLYIDGGTAMKHPSDSGNAQALVTFSMVIGTLVALVVIFGKMYAVANHVPIGHF